MSEIRKTRKNGISWSNKNNIREFPYGSTVGQAIVNSTRPSQPGPLIELRERTFNPVRNAGLTLRPLGVKQTAPIVPDLPRTNMRRNTNKAWNTAKSVMKANRSNRRPLSNGEYASLLRGIYNQKEAKVYQHEFNNPLIPHSTPSTNEPWYKHMLPSQAYGPAVVGASTSPWQRLTPPRVNTSDGGRRYSKKRSYKRSYTKKRSHKK